MTALLSMAILTSLFLTAWSSTVLNFEKFAGMQCEGTSADDIHTHKGTVEECKAICVDLDCVGFVRVNSGSKDDDTNGRCFFRGRSLKEPQEYTADNRDCYRSIRYEIYENSQCEGSSDDVLRDFIGDAEECALKCDETDDCVGFVRVNSGSEFADKCYLRGGLLQKPEEFTADDRDCYKPYSNVLSFVKHAGDYCYGTEGGFIYGDYFQTVEDCKEKCKQLNCASFERVIDSSSGNGISNVGKCYFKGGTFTGAGPTPLYHDDDTDCYESVRYNKVSERQCWGSESSDDDNVSNEFVGSAEACALECFGRDDCVGFIRVNSGSEYAGKCYLRGGVLQNPIYWSKDDRDCYQPM